MISSLCRSTHTVPVSAQHLSHLQLLPSRPRPSGRFSAQSAALSLSLLSGLASKAFGMKRGPVEFNVEDKQRWWSSDTTAVVTGGNQGIGLAIAEILAKQGLNTVLTARRPDAGQKALDELKQTLGNGARLQFHALDISKPASVETFASWAKQELPHGISILVNNAGIASKGDIFGPKEAQETIDTNYAGTRQTTEALLPLMSKGARIVNVCSVAGKERIIRKPKLLHHFQSAKSSQDLYKLAQQFVEAIKADRLEQEGWPRSMYGVSKLLESTYTRLLAERLAPQGIDANACCPGYVSTNMSSYRGYKHISEGADTPCWLALLVPSGTTGGWFTERKQQPF